MKLTDNTILITGGTSGIGLALAEAFADNNNTVIVCGRDMGKIRTLQNHNSDIRCLCCDISNASDQLALVNLVKCEYPSLNILVNNAGIQHAVDFTDSQDHCVGIENEFYINAVAHITLTDRLLPLLLEQTYSAVMNVTSALAVVPKQSAPIYCASKAAMHAFSQSLRYQLENTPVKVFEIIPALVDTAMAKGRGRNKISPKQLADETLRGIASDKFEIIIGKAKLLLLLHRLYPTLAARIIRHG